jgi:membrane protease YdiL (CAAX protease family)
MATETQEQTRKATRSVWLFFVLSFAISWGIWIPTLLLVQKGEESHPLIFVGGYGLFLSAIIVTWRVEGIAGLRKWLARTFRLRVNIVWYLLALFLLPVGIALVQFGLYLFLGGQADFSSVPPWWNYLLSVPIAALFAGGNEEPGWRGFALPKMLTITSPLVASLVIGVIWAGWHIPLFFSQAWLGSTPFVWFLLNTVVLSVIMTWLYLKSSGSVLPVMLFHQATNLVWNYFPMETDVLPTADDWLVLKTLVYGIVAFILLGATAGQIGFSAHDEKGT